MEKEGFFIAPASTRFHNCFEGGLAAHSWDVYMSLKNLNEELKLNIPYDSVIITGLLHDICKVGCYLMGEGGKYKTVKPFPQGHGSRSVELLKQYIDLSELEEKMIAYHMGIYGLKEFDERSGEYSLRGGGLANSWNNYPAVKLIYFCDELATLKEKANDNQ